MKISLTHLQSNKHFRPLDCAWLSHRPSVAEEKHPCVILFYEDVNNKNFYIVAWGTTSPPSEGESRLRIPVKAGGSQPII